MICCFLRGSALPWCLLTCCLMVTWWSAPTLANDDEEKDDSSSTSTRTTYTCDGVVHVLVCPKGSVIYIRNVLYGRIELTPCSDMNSSTENWDFDCMSVHALRVARQQCNGLEVCNLNFNTSSLYGPLCHPSASRTSSLPSEFGFTVTDECTGPTAAWWTTEGASHSPLEPRNRSPDVNAKPTETEVAVSLGDNSTVTIADHGQKSTTIHLWSPSTAAAHTVSRPALGSMNEEARGESSSSTAKASNLANMQEETSSSATSAGGETPGHTVRPGKCPGQRVRGIDWPSMESAGFANMPCPSAIGIAKWWCGNAGHWLGTPDTSDCVSQSLMAAESQLGQNEPDVVLKNVLAVSSSTNLWAGDLVASVRILTNLSKPLADSLGAHSNSSRAAAAVEDIIHISSNLFSPRHAYIWLDLNPINRMRTAAEMLAVTERSVSIVAEYMNSSQVIQAEQAACTISVLPVEDVSNDGVTIHLDNASNTIYFPKDSMTSLRDEQGYVKIVSILTEGAQPFLRESMSALSVGSRILSVTIVGRQDVGNRAHMPLTQPFLYTLNHDQSILPNQSSARNFTCAFWDFTLSGWSDSGCRRIAGSSTESVCECSHLTNFAVLMDVTGTSPKLSPVHEMSLKIITWIGCLVSIICLILSWLTFQLLKNLSCDRNTIHKNLVFTLCLAEMLFLFGLSETGLHVPIVCTVVAALLHFLFLSAFAWMCLEGVQLYMMLIEVFETERSRIGYYYAAGYGMPAIIVAVSAGIDYRSYGTDKYCWLRADTGFIWSFVGPVAAVILVNIAMLGIAIHMMCRHANTAASIKAKEQKKSDSANSDTGLPLPCSSSEVTSARLARKLEECGAWVKASAVLIVLLGLTWIFGFMYVNEESVAMAYVFTVLNSLQGLFIFLFHCVCNDKVQKEYRKFVRRANWLPNCMRIQYGGHRGLYNTTSNSSGSSGNNNKLLIGTRRKRASTASTMQPSGTLPSAARCMSSSNGTAAGLPEYNSLGEESATLESARGTRRFTTFNKHSSCDSYDGMNGELSYADASVVDSDCLSDYCHYNLEGTQDPSLAYHYAVSGQPCFTSVDEHGEADMSSASCACEPLLSGSKGASLNVGSTQPYEVSVICKLSRNQKGLSARGLLQPESDEEDSHLFASPSPAGPLTSFGVRQKEPYTHSNGLATDKRGDWPNGSRNHLTWPARDTIVVVNDKTMRPSKLEPINELGHL